MLGLYVHLPFCKSKCPYCDFYSMPYDDRVAYAYAGAVIRNLNAYNERFDTVYFGGGTPLLMWEDIKRILPVARYRDGSEITVEANPRTVSASAITSIRDSGVNRISIGAQSLSISELKTLGRTHSPDEVSAAIKTAYDGGIRNISVDIMLGIPRQTTSTLKRTIKMLTELPITHVSAYMLKIEKGTPFYHNDVRTADDELMRELYLLTVELLANSGFGQYEISNFSKKGYECKHNLKYWRCEQYLGIGVASHSYYKNSRFKVSPNLRDFLGEERQQELADNDAPGTFEEVAMLKLRLTEGMSFDECERFGLNKKTLVERLKLIPNEYLNISPSGVALTPTGFLVSNEIISKLTLGY